MVTEQKKMDNCIVCSENNPASLGARFYNIEAGVVECVFTGRELHSGYRDRMHGGIIAAVLDETMARTLWSDRPEKIAVTANMDINYLKPIPLELELRCRARRRKETEKIFNAEAEIYLPDGSIAASARGVFVFQSESKMNRYLAER